LPKAGILKNAWGGQVKKGEVMEVYRLFLVGQAKIKNGKFAEATKWWKEKGVPDIL